MSQSGDEGGLVGAYVDAGWHNLLVADCARRLAVVVTPEVVGLKAFGGGVTRIAWSLPF